LESTWILNDKSGIYDFRSPGSGLGEKIDPMLMASFFSFRLQPQAFYEWAHPLARKSLVAEPNPAHRALAELVEDYRLLAADRRPCLMIFWRNELKAWPQSTILFVRQLSRSHLPKKIA